MEFLKVMDDWKGYVSLAEAGRKPDEVKLARALDLFTNAEHMPAYRHEYLMREAITTSDFPYLFGQIVDRQMLANYKAWVADWRAYTKYSNLPDFNIARRHKVWGAEDDLPLVGEKGEYLVAPVGEGRYNLQVFKRGRQFDISWEAIINDSLGAFSNIPERFATAAIRTEARLVTGLYASAAGPNALLYGTPIVDVDLQNVTNLGTLSLTIANFETTLELMAAQVNANGSPIMVRGAHLVVCPALEFTARQILTSALKMWIDIQGGAGAILAPMPTANVISQIGIKLHVDPYLPVIDVSGHQATTWYVFAEPSQGAAIEFAHLRGHENPEICMKASDKVTVAGAAISPFAGDFATDNIFYRVKVVCGGTQLDPRFTYAQNGTT